MRAFLRRATVLAAVVLPLRTGFAQETASRQEHRVEERVAPAHDLDLPPPFRALFVERADGDDEADDEGNDG